MDKLFPKVLFRKMSENLKDTSTLFALVKAKQNSSEQVADANTIEKEIKHFDNQEKHYLKLLSGNRLYAQQKTFDNPDFFKTLSKSHDPKYFLVGCADARVPTNIITQTNPGEIFIHRNIANIVHATDFNCMSALQYAVERLKVDHLIILGHTKCGGIHAANKNISTLGCLNKWLQIIRDVAYLHREKLSSIENEEDFLEALTELNIRHQAMNLCKTSFVQQAWAKGKSLKVHGWLYNIDTGLIRDLKISNKDWLEIKDSYTFNF